MPALTHQDARLIGPFHGRYSVDRVFFAAASAEAYISIRFGQVNVAWRLLLQKAHVKSTGAGCWSLEESHKAKQRTLDG